MNKPVLSICIPTYNRADVLKHCLDAIVNHKISKTGNLEIVVCDNASTDDTQTLMQIYQEKFAFVKYYRNEENIGVIHNTIKVLDCATGEYRKLLNDYSVFTQDGLQYLYEEVVANIEERPVLLFDSGKEETPAEVVCISIDDIVLCVGYRLTWMGVYGYWEEDWKNLAEREKLHGKTFITIDWLLQGFERKKLALVYQYNHTVNGVCNRTQRGYNFFKVFIQDYLDLWSIYTEDNTITSALYKEIKRNLWTFVMGNAKNLLVLKRDKNFDTWNGMKIMLKYYGKEWYFWASWLTYPYAVVKRRIKKHKR